MGGKGRANFTARAASLERLLKHRGGGAVHAPRLGVLLALEDQVRIWGGAAQSPPQVRQREGQRSRVAHLLSLRPEGTAGRDARVLACGVPTAAEYDGRLTWFRPCCRDRWCPACQAARAARLTPRIAAHVEQALERGAALALVTVTRRREEGETPRAAVGAALAQWRALVSSEVWRRGVIGGARALECTYHRAGDRVDAKGRRRRHIVKISGTHAHIHAVVEARLDLLAEIRGLEDLRGAKALRGIEGRARARWWKELRAAWGRVSVGAEDFAQDARWLGGGFTASADRRARVASSIALELGAYVCDGMADIHREIRREPGRAAEYVRLLQALDGRRTLEALGSWRGSLRFDERADHDEEERAPLRFAANSLIAPLTGSRLRWPDGSSLDPQEALARIAAEGPKGLGAVRRGTH